MMPKFEHLASFRVGPCDLFAPFVFYRTGENVSDWHSLFSDKRIYILMYRKSGETFLVRLTNNGAEECWSPESPPIFGEGITHLRVDSVVDGMGTSATRVRGWRPVGKPRRGMPRPPNQFIMNIREDIALPVRSGNISLLPFVWTHLLWYPIAPDLGHNEPPTYLVAYDSVSSAAIGFPQRLNTITGRLEVTSERTFRLRKNITSFAAFELAEFPGSHVLVTLANGSLMLHSYTAGSAVNPGFQWATLFMQRTVPLPEGGQGKILIAEWQVDATDLLTLPTNHLLLYDRVSGGVSVLDFVSLPYIWPNTPALRDNLPVDPTNPDPDVPYSFSSIAEATLQGSTRWQHGWSLRKLGPYVFRYRAEDGYLEITFVTL